MATPAKKAATYEDLSSLPAHVVERLPSIPDLAYFTLAPDRICEVLSPSTASFDRKDKLPIYAREKVAHAWLVDPALKLHEGYKLVDGRWTLLSTHANADRVRAEPFDAIELELAPLWE